MSGARTFLLAALAATLLPAFTACVDTEPVPLKDAGIEGGSVPDDEGHGGRRSAPATPVGEQEAPPAVAR